jgi:hypothetical protein
MKARICIAEHELHAGAAVSMHDSRDAFTPIRLDRTSKQHEFVARRMAANLEPLIGVFGRHAWCKRSEPFAVLDPMIEDVGARRE